MKGGKRPLGYTIIEVMIVLAVSSLMFLIAASFINGKQARTAFTQGVNTMASNLQTMIEDISNGHYSDVSFSCTNPAGTSLHLTGGGAGQGTNPDCVFLGKVVHFAVKNPSNPSTPERYYEVFSLAGARTDKTVSPNIPQTNPLNALATPICVPGSCNGTYPDFTTQATIPQGLSIATSDTSQGMQVTDTTGVAHNAIYGIGFVQGFGNGALNTTDHTNYQSGSPTISMVYAPGLSTVGLTENQAAAHLLPIPIGNGILAAKRADICLTDDNRKADITIGTNDSQLSVTVQMGATLQCS
jgi:prepilin-type N-terminal cleavage/methylation domain-containing protein